MFEAEQTSAVLGKKRVRGATVLEKKVGSLKRLGGKTIQVECERRKLRQRKRE